MTRTLLWLGVLLIVLAAVLLRPVRVGGDGAEGTAWLWAWQRGSASFTNSVTHEPVRISFGLWTGFDRFSMTTDEKTEHYYTSGSYAIDDRLAGQRTGELAYCSMVGIQVQLGARQFDVADGCLQLTLLWPPQLS